MENALILFRQLMQMVIYMAIGVAMYKTKLITKENSIVISNLLLYAVLPCAIVNSFFMEFNSSNQTAVLLSMGLSAAALAFSVTLSVLIYRRDRVKAFAAGYSSAGFMGIPLVAGMYGNRAVCYIAGFVAFLNLAQWIHGQMLLGDKGAKLTIRKCLLNPYVIALLAGLAVFFLRLPVPEMARRVISSLGACNAPLAMIVLGVFMAQNNLKTVITDRDTWTCSLVRLVIIPLLTLAGMKLVPAEYDLIRMSVLVVAAAPVGSTVAMYVQKMGLDHRYSSGVVCFSTLLSLLFMPLIIWAAQLIR